MLVPVWSLRRNGTLGIGDTTAVRELVDWAAGCELGFCSCFPSTRPASITVPITRSVPSPLEPSLLDLGLVPQLTEDDISRACQKLAPEVFTNDLVDYASVKKLKRALLKVAFARFWAQDRKTEGASPLPGSVRKRRSGWIPTASSVGS